MKFEKFKELRENAIRKLGLNEDAELSEYKTALNETELEADNWGDFFFDLLRSMRNISRLKAWYTVYNKKRLKLYMAKVNLQQQTKANTVKQEEKAKEAGEKMLAGAKDPKQKEALEAKIKQQISMIKKKTELTTKKQIAKISAQEKDLDAWMRRKEDKNELKINYIARKWTYTKDLADANLEYSKGKAELDAIKKFFPDSDPKKLEGIMKGATEDQKKKEAKAEEVKKKADELQKQTEEANKEKMEEFKKEFEPKMAEFNKATSEFEAAADEVLMDKEKLVEIKKMIEESDDDEEKETLRGEIEKGEEAVKESKKKMVKARKAANEIKDSISMEKAKKIGMDKGFQQLFDEWQKKQDEFKEELASLDDKEAEGGKEDKDKDKEKGEADTEAIKKEIEAAKEEYDKAQEAEKQAAEGDDNAKKTETKKATVQAKIKWLQGKQKLAKAEKDDEKAQGFADEIGEEMKKIQDIDKEGKEKGEKDEQKKRESEEKRKELEKKISSAEKKIEELKEKDPEKAEKIKANVDKLYDKLDKLDKESNESEYMSKLLEIEGEIDVLLLELEEPTKKKTMKFADFLEMKKNK